MYKTLCSILVHSLATNTGEVCNVYVCCGGDTCITVEWINEAHRGKQCLAQLAKKEICLPVILIQKAVLCWNTAKYKNKKYQPPINQLCEYHKSKHQSVCYHRHKFCSCLRNEEEFFIFQFLLVIHARMEASHLKLKDWQLKP